MRSGLVFGGGAEWVLTNNISLRAEYLRYVFGSSEGPTRFTPGSITGTTGTTSN